MAQLMVILIVLVVPLADDLGWHPGSAGSWLWLAQLCFPVAVWLIGSLVARAERLRPARADRLARRVRLVVPVWHACSVMLLGWASEVRSVTGDLVVVDEVLIMLPALMGLVAGRGLALRLRLELLPIVVPLLLLQAWAEVVDMLLASRIGPGWLEAVQLVGVLVLIGLMPEVLRRMWHTEPMPEGDLRTRMEGSLSRARVRTRDVLVWKTRGRLTNAAVMGILPRLRYILFTDVLLAVLDPDELDGVAAHEIGHVRHKHLIWLVLAILASLASSVVVVELLGLSRPFADVAAIVAVGLGVFFGFGAVSRIFERQADAFAAAHLSRGWGEDRISERAVDAFNSALSQVSMMGGMPRSKWTWRHGSIAGRQRRLSRLVGVGFDRVPADRVARRAMLAIVLTLAASIGVGVLIG